MIKDKYLSRKKNVKLLNIKSETERKKKKGERPVKMSFLLFLPTYFHCGVTVLTELARKRKYVYFLFSWL